jgi:hypothetical protein
LRMLFFLQVRILVFYERICKYTSLTITRLSTKETSQMAAVRIAALKRENI